MLTLNSITPAPGSRVKKFRIGRGEGSGRGKTSGKGTKGQRARTGGRKRLKLKGLKQMLLAFPKLRGFQSGYDKAVTLDVSRVAKKFGAASTVDLKTLIEKRIVPNTTVKAKLVGNGEVGHALKVVGIAASASAKAAIEKAGGSVEPVAKKKPAKKKA